MIEDVTPPTEDQLKQLERIDTRFTRMFTHLSPVKMKQLFKFDEKDKQPAIVHTVFENPDTAEKAITYLEEEYKKGKGHSALLELCNMPETRTTTLKTKELLADFLVSPHYRCGYERACALTQPHKFMWCAEIRYNSHNDAWATCQLKAGPDIGVEAEDYKYEPLCWDKQTGQLVADTTTTGHA